MPSIAEFVEIVRGFPEVEEKPHFEKISFRVKNKILATLSEKDYRITLKLSEADQDVYGLFDPSSIYPVPNKWGKQGWTFVELNTVHRDILMDALKSAYTCVAPKHLVDLLNKNS
ncbi:MAG: MmcQ/YjbR family DNA-binding protein [Saprospiraceae bacterium]|nr:MmcQ/YjbR family DNA-binding protein [Saprospiraceae bacterium]